MAEMPNVILDETIETEWGNAIRDRTVQRYANVTERSALIPSPTEGDLAYMEDTNTVLYYDGSNWRQLSDVGSVLMGGIKGAAGGFSLGTYSPTTVSLTFTPPASWLTYSIMGWGSVNAQGMSELPGAAKFMARFSIGGVVGTEQEVWVDYPSGEQTANVLHFRTGLSGPVVLVIDKKCTLNGVTQGILNAVSIHYIATRLT